MYVNWDGCFLESERYYDDFFLPFVALALLSLVGVSLCGPRFGAELKTFVSRPSIFGILFSVSFFIYTERKLPCFALQHVIFELIFALSFAQICTLNFGHLFPQLFLFLYCSQFSCKSSYLGGLNSFLVSLLFNCHYCHSCKSEYCLLYSCLLRSVNYLECSIFSCITCISFFTDSRNGDLFIVRSVCLLSQYHDSRRSWSFFSSLICIYGLRWYVVASSFWLMFMKLLLHSWFMLALGSSIPSVF